MFFGGIEKKNIDIKSVKQMIMVCFNVRRIFCNLIKVPVNKKPGLERQK